MVMAEGSLPVSQVVTILAFASRDRDSGRVPGPGVSEGPAVPVCKVEGVLCALGREGYGGRPGCCELPGLQGIVSVRPSVSVG